MKKYAWDLHYKFDREYWWAQGRKELIIYLLTKHLKNLGNKKILDLGCGSGALIEELRKLGAKEYGIDHSVQSIKYCSSLGLNVKKADVTGLPYKNNYFDAVVAIDSLEHVDNEDKVIKEAKRVLKRRGKLLVIVPAFQRLWSSRDKRLGHKRRYIDKQLIDLANRGGFKVLRTSYFVTFFFPAYLFIRSWENTDLMLTPKLLNIFFLTLLRFENLVLKYFNLPFGVSVFLLAQK